MITIDIIREKNREKCDNNRDFILSISWQIQNFWWYIANFRIIRENDMKLFNI